MAGVNGRAGDGRRRRSPLSLIRTGYMGFFEAFLVRRGGVSVEHLLEALEGASARRPRLGQLALHGGRMSVAEVCDVLDRQVESRLPFGAIAVDSGYLTQAELTTLLAEQRRSSPTGAELLESRGFIDGTLLSELHDAYVGERASEFADGTEDEGMSELLAAQGLPLALARVECVRPFSKVVLRVLQALDQDDVDLNEVVRRFESDPSLAAHVVRFAGAAWFSRGRSVNTVREAVMWVGARRLKELILTSSFFGLFTTSARAALQVRAHSAGVAAIAFELARWAGLERSESILLGALMHDVGKLLLIQSGEIDFEVLGIDEAQFPDSAHLIERLRLGYDHAVLGELALRLWHFPSELCSLVGMHHYHRPPPGIDSESRTALGLIELSDQIEHSIGARHDLLDADLVGVVSRFGLGSVIDLDSLEARANELVQARAQALKLFG